MENGGVAPTRKTEQDRPGPFDFAQDRGLSYFFMPTRERNSSRVCLLSLKAPSMALVTA